MLRFQVVEMACGRCASTITDAIRGVGPGADIAVDLTERTVEVSGTAADAALIHRAIQASDHAPFLRTR